MSAGRGARAKAEMLPVMNEVEEDDNAVGLAADLASGAVVVGTQGKPRAHVLGVKGAGMAETAMVAAGVGPPGVGPPGVGPPGVGTTGVGTPGVSAPGVGTAGMSTSALGTSRVGTPGVGAHGVPMPPEPAAPRKKSPAILKRGANISAARKAAADAKRRRDLVFAERRFRAEEGEGEPEVHEEELSAATRRNVSQVKGKRKERIKWTEQEVLALKEGVQKRGPGKWAVILREYADAFHPSRISVDLKDKWRNIFKIPKAPGRRGRKRKRPESAVDDEETAAKKAKDAFSRAKEAYPPPIFTIQEESEAMAAEAHAEAARAAAAAAEALLEDGPMGLRDK